MAKASRKFGILAGAVKYTAEGKIASATPSTAVVGVGKIEQRRTVVAADDFTIRGGSSEAAVAEKWIYADRYAWEYKLPIIRMIDSAGGGAKLLDKLGHTKIPVMPCCRSPTCWAPCPWSASAHGACAGLGALRVAASHLSIMVRGQSQVFAAGPPVVKQAFGIDIDKNDLGGYDQVHRHSGMINLAGQQRRRGAGPRPSASCPTCRVMSGAAAARGIDGLSRSPRRLAQRCHSP